MDPSSDWTTTNPLLSPSKALHHQSQAKDWASVDLWLQKKYPRPPTFERNDSTLQALLTLATLNEAADEQRALIDRVQKTALQAYRNAAVEGGRRQADLRELFKGMEGDEGLEALARVVVELGVGDGDVGVEVLAEAVGELVARDFAGGQAVRLAEGQLEGLKAERRRAEAQLAELREEAFQPADDLPQQTVEWVRSSKQLRAKIGEYDERLASMRAAEQPKVRVEDVTRQQGELRALQGRLKDLQVQMDAFGSLPTDATAARAKLEAARDELRRLTRERNELFENMVDG